MLTAPLRLDQRNFLLQWLVVNAESDLAKVHRVRDSGVLSPPWDIYHSKAQGPPWTSSELVTAAAYMNSLKLWPFAQDLNKNGSINTFSGKGKGIMGPPAIDNELQRRSIIFFSTIVTIVTDICPSSSRKYSPSHTPANTLIKLKDHSGRKAKNQEDPW